MGGWFEESLVMWMSWMGTCCMPMHFLTIRYARMGHGSLAFRAGCRGMDKECDVTGSTGLCPKGLSISIESSRTPALTPTHRYSSAGWLVERLKGP